MSLALTIAGAPPPSPEELRRVVPDDAEVLEQDAVAAYSGGVAWLVCPEQSVRGVPVLWSEGEGVVLPVLSLASPEDVELAVVIAATLAELAGCEVGDHAGAWEPSAFRIRWDPPRCRRFVQSDARALLAMMGREPIRIRGIRRAVVLGPRMRAGLEADVDRLMAWARWTQWGLPETTEVARARPLRDRVARPRVAPLTAGPAVLLPRVEFIEVVGQPPHLVRWSDLDQILDAPTHSFDEHRVLVLARSGADFRAVRARSAKLHVASPVSSGQQSAGGRAVLPRLRPPDWPQRGRVACWPLAERGEGLPLVTLVRDAGTRYAVVDVPSDRRDAMLARAVQRLEARLPPWEAWPDADRALHLDAPFAAEVLLSRDRLLEAQERLGARALLAAVPEQGSILVQDAFPEDESLVAQSIAWAEERFALAVRSAQGRPLCQPLLIVVDGVVQGAVRDPISTESSVEDFTMDSERLGRIAWLDETPPPPSAAAEAPSAGIQIVWLSVLLPGLGQVWQGAQTVGVGFLVVEAGVLLLTAVALASVPASYLLLVVALGSSALVGLRGLAALDAWVRRTRVLAGEARGRAS